MLHTVIVHIVQELGLPAAYRRTEAGQKRKKEKKLSVLVPAFFRNAFSADQKSVGRNTCRRPLLKGKRLVACSEW